MTASAAEYLGGTLKVARLTVKVCFLTGDFFFFLSEHIEETELNWLQYLEPQLLN